MRTSLTEKVSVPIYAPVPLLQMGTFKNRLRRKSNMAHLHIVADVVRKKEKIGGTGKR